MTTRAPSGGVIELSATQRAALAGVSAVLLLVVLLKLGIWWGLRQSGLPAAEQARRRRIAALWEGWDGAASTSKFQWFAWTAAVLGAYVAVYVRAGSVSDMSENLLAVIGVATITMVASKAVTAHLASTGKIEKKQAPSGEHKGGLVLDDDGYLDLSKAQLMAWTLVGIGIFLWEMGGTIASASSKLPEVSDQLMFLMGIGHAGYLGKKVSAAIGNKPEEDKHRSTKHEARNVELQDDPEKKPTTTDDPLSRPRHPGPKHP